MLSLFPLPEAPSLNFQTYREFPYPMTCQIRLVHGVSMWPGSVHPGQPGTWPQTWYVMSDLACWLWSHVLGWIQCSKSRTTCWVQPHALPSELCAKPQTMQQAWDHVLVLDPPASSDPTRMLGWPQPQEQAQLRIYGHSLTLTEVGFFSKSRFILYMKKITVFSGYLHNVLQACMKLFMSAFCSSLLAFLLSTESMPTNVKALQTY